MRQVPASLAAPARSIGQGLLAALLVGLAGCTLSFELVADDGGRDARAPDGGVADGRALDAAPDPGGDGGGDSMAPDGGPDASPGCGPEVCPSGPCTAATCRPDGTCGLSPLPPGSACEDGDPCTGFETCDASGVCVAGMGCEDDGNPCTDELCTDTGCQTLPRDDGSSCARSGPDGICCARSCVDPVTDPTHCGTCGRRCGSGLCAGGDCVACSSDSDCDPGPALRDCVRDAKCEAGACTINLKPDRCIIDGRCYSWGELNPANDCELCSGGTSWSTASTCDDGAFCTQGDACVTTAGGLRCEAASARDCGDANPCTLDSCNEAADTCEHRPAPDGTPCDDADPCTTNGRCVAGACHTDPTCPAAGPCEIVTCDPMLGACRTTFLSDGAPCDDGDPCTDTDRCRRRAGLVVCAGVARCTDDICGAGVCDAMTGSCGLVPFPPGTTCEPMAGCLGECDGTGSCVNVVCG